MRGLRSGEGDPFGDAVGAVEVRSGVRRRQHALSASLDELDPAVGQWWT